MTFPQLDEQGRFGRELRDASMASRFFAKAIDVLCCALAGGLPALVSGRGWVALVGPLLLLASDAVGSPGKWLLQIEAVRLDGRRAGLFGSLSRNLTLALPPLAGILVAARLIETELQPAVEGGLIGCLGLTLLLIEAGSLLLDRHNRRWSDQFSNTRVVDR